jgi:RNA polymerase sigma-70 factor (ECF subfamily)
MEDLELIQEVQKGDQSAFEEIMRRYKNRIVNFLWQMTGDYEKAVEISQETFLRVYFKADRYRPIAPLSSWIYAIASNLAKTELKKARRNQHVSLEDVQYSISGDIPYEEKAVNSEEVKCLKEAVQNLHPRYRIPLILKDIEGYSQEEIAQILNKPLGTIKARISRARQYVKKEMDNPSLGMKLCEE